MEVMAFCFAYFQLLVSCFLLENTLFTTRILLILSTRSRTHCTHHHEKIVLELRACAKSDPLVVLSEA